MISIVPCFFPIVIAFANQSQHAETLHRSESVVGPRIEATYRNHDFGIIRSTDEPSHTFVFRNTGDQDLQIVDIYCACDCFLNLESERTLSPGEEGRLMVSYVSTRRQGADREVILTTNDPRHKTVTFTITATVFRQVEVVPLALSFGTVPSNSSQRLDFTVNLRKSDKVPVITSIHATRLDCQVRIVEEQEHDWGKSIVYSVDCDFSTQVVAGAIVLQTDSLENPVIEIPISASIIFQGTSVPPRLLFGMVDTGSTSNRECDLTLASPSDIPLPTVTCADSRVRLHVEPSRALGKWTIRVAFTPGRDEKRLDSTIIVHDEKGMVLCVIPIRGSITVP